MNKLILWSNSITGVIFMKKGNILLNFFKKLEPFYSQPYRYFYNSEYFLSILAEYENVPYDDMDREAILALLVNKIYFNPLVDTKYIARYNLTLLKKVVDADPIPNINWARVEDCLIKLNIEESRLELGILFDFEHMWYGEESSMYFHNVANYRKEFPLLSDSEYYERRVNEIEHLLASEHIYNTDYFRQKYEKRAKFNLTTELKMLKPETINQSVSQKNVF